MANSGSKPMLKMSIETVEKVAQLSRLKLTADELSMVQTQLSIVLENFEQISQVNTDGVVPLLSPSDITQTLRQDVAVTFESEKILMNAPESVGRLFKVPPVV